MPQCLTLVGMSYRDALTCAFVNTKPGTGKTTCTVLTAAAFATMPSELTPTGQPHRVLAVDADPGGSLSRWSDMAEGGLPFDVIGMARPSISRELPRLVDSGEWTAVCVDLGQGEDHERVVRAVLEIVGHHIVTVAPSGIELDRMSPMLDLLDRADPDQTARRWALLNRCNTWQATRTGADKETRDLLSGAGLTVFRAQIKHSDALRQEFGRVPLAQQYRFHQVAEEITA